MTPALLAALASALDLTADEAAGLELVVHVSASGRSHVEPGLRLFAYRGATPLASVKRLARPSDATRARLLDCYARLADCQAFRVPSLLGWGADDVHLYVVESLVPGHSLAEQLGRGTLAAEEATARLSAVLAALWERGVPATADEIGRHAAILQHTAATVFADQRARDLVGAVLDILRAQHPTTLRRVLTTRDVHIANVHVDADGQTWLTDFDLTDEVVFFGLDVVRTWIHSAPLRSPGPPPFLAPDAYRLYEAVYPIYEYLLQAPLLAEPERETLRAYTQDLFVRLTLPAYHRHAMVRAEPRIADAPRARLFVSDDDGGFGDAVALEVPFDLDRGSARASTVVHSDRPLRRLRLDPINRAHSVVSVRRWTLAPLAQRDAVFDAGQRCGTDATGAAAQLTHLLALPGAAPTFFAAADTPQIVVAIDPAPNNGAGGQHAYALEVELGLEREWALAPDFAPALLLGRLQSRIATLHAALTYELAHARDLTADVRRQARVARRLATRVPLEGESPPPAPLGVAALRAHLARLPALVRGGARLLATEAVRRLRGGPAPAAAAPPSGLMPVERSARAWAPPHVAVIVDGDAEPPATDAALAWTARQTCASTEVIVLARAQGLAWNARLPQEKWNAADWAALRATLAARYVVFAAPSLWAESPTYLERALLALEPEDLSFAITVGRAAAPAATALLSGRGPGTDGDPLARTVARPEVVSEDGQLDLDACRAERGAGGGALGKLLGDTGAPAGEAPLFARPLLGAAVGVLGPYVVGDPTSGFAAAHPIAAVDRALALPPIPSALPTVLMVFPFLAVGGAERVHLDVVRGLRDRIRFVIAAIEAHDDHLGSTVGAFRALTPYVYTAPDTLHPLLTFSFFEHLIQRFAPRTLYIANGSAWIYDALTTIRAHHPGLRTVDQVYDHAAGWIERLDAPLLAAFDAHISCNRQISAALVARGADADAAVTLHNAVDLDLFDPAPFDAARRAALAARFGLPAGRKVVLFIGRMHQQKRPMDVVELARQLRGDSRLAFLMVGDGHLASTVREQVAASGLDNIQVHAFHQPSSECYALADVLVLPSEYEGMPMVILEALAMGVPVVATDVGNNREVLARTGGGRIVDRIGDVPALRHAVLTVLETPFDAAAARAAVAREFGMADMCEHYAQVLLGPT